MTERMESPESRVPGRGVAIAALVGILLLTVIALRLEGRRWWCACGSAVPWSGDTKSAHNSQHLVDPYSLTHILHGVALAGVFAIALPRLSAARGFIATIAIESLWEVVENSHFVIDRYRTATMALGYEGDSVVNSLGDIASCALGWVVARRLGWKWSIALFVAVEVVLLFWIRDNLALNVLMLAWPMDSVKRWQMGL